MISFLSLLFLELLAVATITVSFSNGSTYVGCHQSEREALLSFKHDLNDTSNRLSSWVGDHGDCCKWDAVVCSNFTGNVLELHLGNPFNNYSSDAEYEVYERSQLRGKISSSLLDLKHLVYLDLSYNDFEGVQIPRFLGSMSNLRYLNLTKSFFAGMIPHQLGNLSTLQYLDLSHDSFIYAESLSWLSGLSSLKHLDMTYVSLTVASDWLLEINKLSSLTVLRLSGCRLQHIPLSPFPNFTSSLITLDLSSNRFDNTSIPSWVFSLRNLEFLGLGGNNFKGPIPDGLQNLTSLQHLDLSYNYFNSSIPNQLSRIRSLESLDLSYNSNLQGPLPLITYPYALTLDLSNNVFSGSIAQFLCHKIIEPRETQVLKLGSNSFSGELPNCWMNWQYLYVLELSDNNFTGILPFSIGNLSVLQSLHLRNNKFFGEIPLSLKNCTELVTLDIGENEFSGNIPTWIGERFSELVILNLRSNKFDGLLPREFCHLTSLQIMDLAYNNLSGSIPSCIRNFSAMAAMNYSKGNSIQYYTEGYESYIEDALLVIKGKTSKYKSILNLVRNMDLSKNKFSGEIPMEVTSLCALQSLNLSYNSLTGRIPETIGDMREIESLDLSANRLFGEIPQSITSLTFLDNLNLSNNKLIGRIPLGTQLQSFNASSFTGNELCGSPLKNCTVATVPTPRHENGEQEVDWFYVSMALGFMVGFWSLIGPLLINRRWRYMYCRFLDRIGDKLYFGVRKLC
ncbi:hypothetical protein LWI28_007242 [Acer negundo]|uniref:Leucine-rich repeat-containing N-terminal plant-type domain-containing protein n=1 Tax=Acer negundo TaxID=4023 RepID=A0AAD5J472_ACENE|nr:hypothetical protein LWI28_007242 [Acer negundo]